jgi:hypothetical protein
MNTEVDRQDNSQPRKPYSSPKLLEYGNLEDMTLGTGGTNADFPSGASFPGF